MDLVRELKKKKLRNQKVTVIPVVISALGTIPKNLVKKKKNRKVEDRGTSGDHPNYSIIEVSQNTEKSP